MRSTSAKFIGYMNEMKKLSIYVILLSISQVLSAGMEWGTKCVNVKHKISSTGHMSAIDSFTKTWDNIWSNIWRYTAGMSVLHKLRQHLYIEQLIPS